MLWYSGLGRSVAAEAWAQSNKNFIGTRASVFTDCRRYRAGSNSNYSDETNLTTEIGTPIINVANIYAGTDIYDNVNNTITLNNFGGTLHINTENLINEYALVKVEIFRIYTDVSGLESEELITRSQAKIINGQFVSSQYGPIFTQNDFTLIQNNSEIQASLLFESKTINLNYDITEDMVIEIRMISDAGHIEDGESEEETDPVTMLVSNTINAQATFRILSDLNRTGTLMVRNASGVILSTQSNIVLTQNQPSDFTFSLNNSASSPFYVVQFISSDAIIVVRKFVLY